MTKGTTLKELIELHPEWADVPIGIYTPDGHYDYLDGAGTVYLDEQDEGADRGPVLVFAGN